MCLSQFGPRLRVSEKGNEMRRVRALGAVLASFGAAVILDGAPARAQSSEQGTTRTLAPIDWPTVQRDAAAAGVEGVRPGGGGLVSFEGSGRASADNLQIPVLLPRSLIDAGRLNQLDAPLELLARTNDYSAEARAAPRSYLIQGTRVIFEIDGEAPPPQNDPGPVNIEQTAYGIEASFARYGVMYSITIHCALPSADPQCNNDARIRELAAEMTFVP